MYWMNWMDHHLKTDVLNELNGSPSQNRCIEWIEWITISKQTYWMNWMDHHLKTDVLNELNGSTISKQMYWMNWMDRQSLDVFVYKSTVCNWHGETVFSVKCQVKNLKNGEKGFHMTWTNWSTCHKQILHCNYSSEWFPNCLPGNNFKLTFTWVSTQIYLSFNLNITSVFLLEKKNVN